MNKLSVAVLGGGPSSEYEVSLRSAAKVVDQLDKQKYEVTPVIINKLGGWHIGGKRLSQSAGLALLQEQKVDVVFIAMHGEYGEDGTIQRLLDAARLTYTGSGAIASELAIDKARSLQKFAKAGLTLAKSQVVTKEGWDKKPALRGRVTYPVVVKPVACGSSVGVSIVTTPDGLPAALKKAFARDNDVLVEEFVSGREVTCGVLDDGTHQALPPTEIIPVASGFFDYKAKYQPGASKEITPAQFPQAVIKRIQDIAVKAHSALGCYGMSRTDMIVAGDRIVVLETNTIPGMTETSLLPQAAAAAGMSYVRLLDRIIGAALKHKMVK